jgi:hypothetical protein
LEKVKDYVENTDGVLLVHQIKLLH